MHAPSRFLDIQLSFIPMYQSNLFKYLIHQLMKYYNPCIYMYIVQAIIELDASTQPGLSLSKKGDWNGEQLPEPIAAAICTFL